MRAILSILFISAIWSVFAYAIFYAVIKNPLDTEGVGSPIAVICDQLDKAQDAAEVAEEYGAATIILESKYNKGCHVQTLNHDALKGIIIDDHGHNTP